MRVPVHPRFQFGLRDLVLTVVAAGLVMVFFIPEAFRCCGERVVELPYPCRWHFAPSTYPMVAAIVLVPTLLGGLLGLWWASQRPARGLARVAILMGCTAAGWLAFEYMQACPLFSLGPYPWRCKTNECCAIATCKSFAEAQDIYGRTDWNGDGVLEYARSITGDYSLFERSAGSGDLQLVDQLFAKAEYVNQPSAAIAPKAGYLYRLLTAQGPGASGGRMSYLQEGPDGTLRMTNGYALVACPAVYDGTGRNTFIINQAGIVYTRDLGPGTPELFREMTEFDPTSQGEWIRAE
jgi:hypothetical protein